MSELPSFRLLTQHELSRCGLGTWQSRLLHAILNNARQRRQRAHSLQAAPCGRTCRAPQQRCKHTAQHQVAEHHELPVAKEGANEVGGEGGALMEPSTMQPFSPSLSSLPPTYLRLVSIPSFASGMYSCVDKVTDCEQ